MKDVGEHPLGSPEDREMLAGMPFEKLLDYFFLQIRNLWRVDGLYFLEIEKNFGTETVTKMDTSVWEGVAVLEAKVCREFLKLAKTRTPKQLVGSCG